MAINNKNKKSSASSSGKAAKPRKVTVEVVEAEIVEDEDESEVAEDDEDDCVYERKTASESTEAKTAGRQEVHGEARSFFETLGDGLKSAGAAAQRLTGIGLARAEMEKLRFELKTAHAALGEAAMRSWDDAPDLGLTSKDPSIAGELKKVKAIRLKIREKEARIAELKKEM